MDTDALWHPGAGVIDAETAVLSMTGLAVGAGATLRTDWPVADLRRRTGGYEVVSADGDRPRGYHLSVDGVAQSHVDLDDPTYLEFAYVRWIGHLVDAMAPDSL